MTTGTKRSGYIQARIDSALKNKVELIFKKLGLTPSQAIILFYNQVKIQNGLPFEVKLKSDDESDESNEKDIPNDDTLIVGDDNDAFLNKLLEKEARKL